jgi:hypothetical protein
MNKKGKHYTKKELQVKKGKETLLKESRERREYYKFLINCHKLSNAIIDNISHMSNIATIPNSLLIMAEYWKMESNVIEQEINKNTK